MKRTHWLFLIAGIIAVVAVGFWTVGRDSDRSTGGSITIGAISPFTGDGARYGETARTGIDLAVDEINAAGGINGATLVVQYEDDKGNQADAVSAFNKLVSIDNVPAILGPFYSGNVLAAAPVANRNQVVLLTGSATSDNVRTAGEFVFRVCPSNDRQADTIARYARDQLNLQTAFVIYRNVDYGVTLRDAFESSFTALGGTIVGAEAVPADASDVRAQLAKVKAAAPDLIFAAVHFPEGGALLRQAKELAIDSIVMGTDGGHDPQLIEIAGDAADGSYWVTIGWGDEASNPAVSNFRQAYRDRYNNDPGVYSGLYYDAAKVLARALSAAADDTGTGVRDALMGVRYEGPTGLTEFDANGDVSKPYTIYKVEDGALEPVT